MGELTLQRRPTAVKNDAERTAVLRDPGFGKVFTDHMVTIRYTEGRGWHDAELGPYAPLTLDPSAAVFHYAQEVFEGLKAYCQPDGSVALFRPELNAERFNASSERLAVPPLPDAAFLDAVSELVRADLKWVPSAVDTSLYLRPFVIATEPFLGVRPSREYIFMVIASPVGAYFRNGVEPVSVWLSEEYTRAAPGGTGTAKCGGNYAASLTAQAQAQEHGCDQVVWLDAHEHRWIEEMGGMNVFFVYSQPDGRTTLVTPELTGTLLPGVTRKSILELAPTLGYEVVESSVSTDEWRDGVLSGAITESFACGTAAVITPIGRVKSAHGEFSINSEKSGPVTLALRERLLEIQHGQREDRFGWMCPIYGAA